MEKTSVVVSIIMPVGDETKYLFDAINSIMHQSFKNFELILVGYKEKIPNISLPEEEIKRIKYFYREKKGVGDALNFAVSKSAGKYIARMDADDISLPDRIYEQVNYMEAHDDVAVLGTWWEVIDEAGNILQTAPQISDYESVKAKLVFENPICHPTVMFRRDVFDSGLLYITTPAEDLELWTRLAPYRKFHILPSKLFQYRSHSSNSVKVTGDETWKISTLCTKSYIKEMFHINLNGYEINDFTKNYYLNKIGFDENYEEFLLRQFRLLFEINVANERRQVIKREALQGELSNRWRRVLGNLMNLSKETRDLVDLLRMDRFFIAELAKYYRCDEMDKGTLEKRLWDSLERNRNMYKKLFQDKKKFWMYGFGQYGKRALARYDDLRNRGIVCWELLGIIDKNVIEYLHDGKLFMTHSKESIHREDFDFIMITSSKFFQEIYAELLNAGVASKKIIGAW